MATKATPKTDTADKTRAPRAKAADGSRGVHVAIETLVLSDDEADGLCFAQEGFVHESRADVATIARAAVQELIAKALKPALLRAVIALRESRHDAAVKLAEQEAAEATRKLEALRAAKVAGELLGAEAGKGDGVEAAEVGKS